MGLDLADFATRHLKCDGVCRAVVKDNKVSCPLTELHFHRASRYAEDVLRRAANAITPPHVAANDAARRDARAGNPLIPHRPRPPPAFLSPPSHRSPPLLGPSTYPPTASPAKVCTPARTSRR